MMKNTVKTTNCGPHPHVHSAPWNFNSSFFRPWSSHAFLNLQLERPMENHAIYTKVYSDTKQFDTKKGYTPGLTLPQYSEAIPIKHHRPQNC